MGNGGSDRFEPSRVESGLQACRCKDLRWKGIRRQGWLDKGKLDVIGYRRAVSKEDDQILENFEVAGAVRISHCIERDVAFCSGQDRGQAHAEGIARTKLGHRLKRSRQAVPIHHASVAQPDGVAITGEIVRASW